MAFFLFILLNATLFIRPVEAYGISELENSYLVLIIPCLILSLNDILACVLEKRLDAQPVTLCVFGLAVMVPLPFLAKFDLNAALQAGTDFLKVVIYFLLLVSLVNSKRRLTVFLACILFFCAVLAGTSILSNLQVIQLANVKKADIPKPDPVTGELPPPERLVGAGLFQDPNEMCVTLASLLPLALYFLTARKTAVGNLLGLVTTVLFAIGIVLTRSRGGFLALLTCLGVMSYIHWGGKKTAYLGALGLALVFAVGGGSRQTEIGVRTGTAQARIELWSDWLTTFRANPMLGDGMMMDQSESESGPTRDASDHLAHNSYLQSFADTGFPGGVCFLSAFCLAGWSIQRLATKDRMILDPDMRRLQPFVFGTVAGYAVGLLSLSLSYSVTTYFILGLGTAFVRVVRTFPRLPDLCVDLKVIRRCCVLGVIYLIGIYVFLQVMKIMGVI